MQKLSLLLYNSLYKNIHFNQVQPVDGYQLIYSVITAVKTSGQVNCTHVNQHF